LNQGLILQIRGYSNSVTPYFSYGFSFDADPYFSIPNYINKAVETTGVTSLEFRFIGFNMYGANASLDSVILDPTVGNPGAVAVPAPLAGAGLPALLALAGGWLLRKRYRAA
jgi:hypothetical protein